MYESEIRKNLFRIIKVKIYLIKCDCQLLFIVQLSAEIGWASNANYI